MFGMLEEVSKQQLYLVISFLIDLQAKGDPKLLFPEQKITYDC